MDHPAKSQSRSPSAASVPLNEPRPPLPDWSWRGRAWPIYFREARGSHEAARRGWPAGLAASAHSWGWAVSEASCLSGLGYGYNESRLGDGDGVAAGGGAKPSPASGVREEHQLYWLCSTLSNDQRLPISQIYKKRGFNWCSILVRKAWNDSLMLVIKTLLFSYSPVCSNGTGAVYTLVDLWPS